MIPFLGSTRQLTNSTGTVTLAKSYDPYGTVTHTNGAALSVLLLLELGYGLPAPDPATGLWVMIKP